MTSRHNHIAVIGRIPGDDDDSCKLYHDVTEPEAREAFAVDMFEDEFSHVDDAAERSRLAAEERDRSAAEYGGLGVYITHTLASASPIEEL